MKLFNHLKFKDQMILIIYINHVMVVLENYLNLKFGVVFLVIISAFTH